jgi:arylsulfatase
MANTNDCENGRLIELTYIKDLDKHWLETSLAFLDKMKGSKAALLSVSCNAWLSL